jgi:hypothetical protein
MDWRGLGQEQVGGAVVDMVMNLEVLYTAWKFLTSLRTLSFSRRLLLQSVS